jgi:hypothetical protein
MAWMLEKPSINSKYVSHAAFGVSKKEKRSCTAVITMSKHVSAKYRRVQRRSAGCDVAQQFAA